MFHFIFATIAGILCTLGFLVIFGIVPGIILGGLAFFTFYNAGSEH